MNDESISRTAARLRWAVFGLLVVMVLLYLAARFDLSLGHMRVAYQTHGQHPAPIPLLGDIGLALLMIAIFRLTQMLRAIAAGDYFSLLVTRRFRGFAFWLLLMALAGLFGPLLTELWRFSADWHQALALRLDFREVLTVGITLLLFLLARLLERARALDEEMREIV